MFLGGDVVTAVGGRPVTTHTDLRDWLESERSVGDEVEVTVVRDGAERRLVVRLAERPQ